MNPQRKPATQSRPMENAAAGGLIVRLVGSPAGGRRAAAVFSSFGAAACISIRSLRNRHVVSGAVRRLGFTPIPGRRFNSNPGAFRGERAAWLAAHAVIIPAAGACATVKMASCDWTGSRGAGVASGRARNSSSPLRSALCFCRSDTSSIRNAKRCIPISKPAVDEGRSNILLSRRERRGEYAVRDSQHPQEQVLFVVRHPIILSASRSGSDRAGWSTPDLDIRPALPLASDDALFMARVKHAVIGDSAKNIGGVK